MRILILTQYFPPETGAPQNRLHSLAGYFSDLGAEVSVLTAMPNYPKMEVLAGYKGEFYKFETDKNLKVHRSWIFVNNNKGIVSRLLNYFSFVFSSFFIGLFRYFLRFLGWFFCQNLESSKSNWLTIRFISRYGDKWRGARIGNV
jgi:hypothetical protein